MSGPNSPLTQDHPTSNPSPVRTQSSPPPLARLAPPSEDGATGSPSAAIVTTAAATAAGGTTNPRRLPPPCWSPEETAALIDAYRDKWYALRRGNLKANHWQEVAEAVAARCPAASPQKTAVQCRHKMEKLRKRYRTEIQRARSIPVSRFTSSWVHFKRMEEMEKGPATNKPVHESESGEDDNDDDEDDYPDRNPYSGDGYKNGSASAKTTQRFFNRNGIIGTSGAGGAVVGGSTSGGFRIRIPTGVSIAQPGPRFPGKIDQKYTANPNSGMSSNFNANAKLSAGGSNYGARVFRATEEPGRRQGNVGKREKEREVERSDDPMAEIASAIKQLGDGFVRTEQTKMEMTREIEAMRMEMEMKRTEMILESQQRIVEAFAKALADQKKKKLRSSQTQ